jgi:hypothetical protein
MKLSTLMWAALTVVVGISLFLLKYQVQALEGQLHATYAQIERDKSAIRVLEAEWTYLNDPGRLRRLSEQHLGFVAPTPQQMTTFAQLPYRDGRTPAAEGASAPVVPAPPAPLPTLRSAALSPPPSASAGATFAAAAAPERPSAIAATVARLQRMLPPLWTGTTILPEPPR